MALKTMGVGVAIGIAQEEQVELCLVETLMKQSTAAVKCVRHVFPRARAH